MPVRVVYGEGTGVGYHPVLHAARLCAEVFESSLAVVPHPPVSLVEKLGARTGRRRRGAESLLLIAPSPTHLEVILRVKGWRSQFDRVVAWVFDSFWVDRIPRSTQFLGLDHIFVTEREDLDVWRSRFSVPVEWAPWGSDVLRLGSNRGDRDVDVQRVGRQPPGWDDDETTARACAAAGLAFRGRPPSSDDATENERVLLSVFSRTRYTLSFSNSVSPAVQTHPHRQYITARWTDALAAGATVAGVSPQGPSVEQLLWPEAMLDIGTTELEPALRIIAQERDVWTPERAVLNHRRALERLDWRWRFRDIAKALGVSPPTLERELAELRARVDGPELALPI